MSTTSIQTDELIEIFNRVLDSYPFIFTKSIPIASVRESNLKPYRDSHFLMDYLNEITKDGKSRIDLIEYELNVFESIPSNKIYGIIEDFVLELERYLQSKAYLKQHRKAFENESYKRRKKDLKIIKAYQEMIFDYTADNDYNNDDAYSIFTYELNEVYQFNKKLIHELENRKYKIMDFYRYEGVRCYDATKRPLRLFFNDLKSKYHLKSLSIKQMIDIL